MTLDAHCADPMLQHVFDALPSMVCVVDTDVRIQAYNTAAAELLAAKDGAVLKRRGGEVLGCLHASDSPLGCGHGPTCSNCVVRNAVGEVFTGGRVARQRSHLELAMKGRRIELLAQVTASPLVFEGRDLALLVIEDFSEIMELKRMIPICCVCKKIRDEGNTWSRIEAYFKDQWDVDFSHGYCPECYRTAAIELGRELPAKAGSGTVAKDDCTDDKVA